MGDGGGYDRRQGAPTSASAKHAPERKEEARPTGGFAGGGFVGERESFGGNGEHAAADDDDEELPTAVGGEDEEDELHGEEE